MLLKNIERPVPDQQTDVSSKILYLLHIHIWIYLAPQPESKIVVIVVFIISIFSLFKSVLF